MTSSVQVIEDQTQKTVNEPVQLDSSDDEDNIEVLMERLDKSRTQGRQYVDRNKAKSRSKVTEVTIDEDLIEVDDVEDDEIMEIDQVDDRPDTEDETVDDFRLEISHIEAPQVVTMDDDEIEDGEILDTLPCDPPREQIEPSLEDLILNKVTESQFSHERIEPSFDLMDSFLKSMQLGVTS